ncbi:MAG TPA: hypothetical protein VM097_12715 [Mycobacteriales bacterium]|nr:hypothetical protein [Mycobacteriales bacterium]
MPTQRWTAPWTEPTGAAPERPPGEPGFAVLVAVHVAVLFGLAGIGSIAPAVAGTSETAAAVTLLVLFALTAAGGLLVRTQPAPMAAWVADLLLAASSAYLFGGAGTLAHERGASDPASFLSAALAVLPWAVLTYALHRRVWTQVATVLAFAVALQASLAMRPEVPDEVAAGYLLILGAFLALLALSGIARPVRSAAVLAALLATAGARVLVSEQAVLGPLMALAVLALVVVAVVRSGNRSLLPVTLLAGVLLGPPTLEPLIGRWQALGLSAVLAAAVAGWLSVDLNRRAVRPRQVGGVFAVGLTVVLLSVLTLLGHGPHERAVDLVHALAVAAFFAAAAADRRRPAAVVAGLLVLAELPEAIALGAGDSVEGLVALAVAAGAVALMVRMRTWQPRPVAAPDQQEVALSGEGRAWTVASPYPLVFDTVVAVLGGAGVPLQLVDRAAGRVVAGDPLHPLLVVAVWASDPVRAHVRAVGAAWDVDRLEADVEARLAQRAPNEVAGPH